MQQIACHGAAQGQVEDGGPDGGGGRRQVDPAVQKQGAKGCHPQGGGGLQGGEGEGIHPIQGLLPKDQRPRQQQGGEEGEQFPPPKARQAPLAAEEVEAQNHHQLDGDVLLPHPAPVDGQGQQGGHHRGQGTEKGHRSGGGELQGDVVGHIGPAHTQAGQQPIFGGAGPEPLEDPPAKEQQEKDQGNAIPGGEQGVNRQHLIGGFGDGVPKPVEEAL